jgi:hypothetical protein
MAVHDYVCSVCATVVVDVHVPVTIGQRAGAPLHCGHPMSPIPGIGSMDYGAVKGVGFKGFTTTDGRGTPVAVNSLHDLRRIERESEIAARNGEGQPMVWRRWAQDGSNQDQPTLSKSYYGGDAPTAAAKHRFGSTLRKSGSDAEGALSNASLDRSFGPGVSETNASALGLEGKP